MLRPGDRITVVHGDSTRTEVLESVSYRSPSPATWPTLPWWQRVLRAITPRRWRAPLQPIRPADPSGVVITTDSTDRAHLERLHRLALGIERAMEALD